MSQATPQTRSANEYLKMKVLSANPEELRLMLLEGAIKFGRQGREALAVNKHEAAFLGISQCRNIVFELLTTIREDIDPELATNAKALYAFMYREIVDAGFERDVKKLDRVLELLEYERETWVMLMGQLSRERGIAPAPAERKGPFSLQG